MTPHRSILNLLFVFTLLAVTGCGVLPAPKPTAAPVVTEPTLFDDFSYTGQDELAAHGWIVRSEAGWPGIPGAAWPKENVTFVADPQNPDNRVMRMTSSTDGKTVTQTQVCQQRKYLEGTYAARIRFSDAPVAGPDGDQIVETFYMISPLKAPMDPDYSEMDNEYLPNGGWGGSDLSFYNTTWETAQIDPWIADNTSAVSLGSLDGWHTLVMQVAGGTVEYYVDGNYMALHGDKYYPEVPMSINFNLWFIQGGQLPSSELRQYSEDVDWVLHVKGAVLSPAQVDARIAELRQASVKFQDSIPPADPPLPSPCNL